MIPERHAHGTLLRVLRILGFGDGAPAAASPGTLGVLDDNGHHCCEEVPVNGHQAGTKYPIMHAKDRVFPNALGKGVPHPPRRAMHGAGGPSASAGRGVRS
jgi:hypothetical protein